MTDFVYITYYTLGDTQRGMIYIFFFTGETAVELYRLIAFTNREKKRNLYYSNTWYRFAVPWSHLKL